jgi:coenzyme F420-dependent glucose-6-phosphate dehydrogenase
MEWPLRIGYTVSHEQYPPTKLLEFAVAAEKAGFDSIWSSDHFHPWFHTDASAGFAWVWMASAAEKTKRVHIGSGVTCPLLRYHPAIVAQAFATLGYMYPGRIFLGLGTGEAMNEVPLGYEWPGFKERAQRFEEAIKIIKLLWSESWVTFKGRYYRLKKANLYTRPDRPVPLYVAASGPTVTKLAGKYADGFLTIPFPESHYREVLFPALEQSARQAGRDPSEIDKAVEVYVSYDEDHNTALASVRRWAGTSLPFVFKYPIADPREIEFHGNLVGDKQLAESWLIGTSPEQHIKWVEKYIRLGFRNIHITSSSPKETKTVEIYSKYVLPYLRTTYA